MKEPRVAIITINYHKEEKTLALVDSLKQQNYENYSITIVDNATQEDAFKDMKYKNINLIRNPENSGWAVGFRMGVDFILHKEKPDYFLLLNNDQTVDKDMLNKLIETAESDPKIGYVSPTIYSLHEKDKVLTHGGYINYWTGIGTESRRPKNNEVQEVKGNEFMDDCACLVKREVLEQAGFHDPIYFLYFEEVDWNIAIRKAGFKVMHNPNAKIYHELHGSSEGEKSPIVVYYTNRNRSLFIRKQKPFRFPIFLLIYTFMVMPLIFLKYLFKRKFNLLWPLIKGYFAGIFSSIAFPKFSNDKL